jgi:hypothetical protein
MFREYFSANVYNIAVKYSKLLEKKENIEIESDDEEANTRLSILSAYLHEGLFIVFSPISNMTKWKEEIDHVFQDLVSVIQIESNQMQPKKIKKIMKDKKKYKLVVLLVGISFLENVIKNYKHGIDGIIIDDINFIKAKEMLIFESIPTIQIHLQKSKYTNPKKDLSVTLTQYMINDVYITMNDEEHEMYVEKLDKLRHAYKLLLSSKKLSINDLKKRTAKACYERHLSDIQNMSTYIFYKCISEHDQDSILNAKEGCKLSFVKNKILKSIETNESLIIFSKYLIPLLILFNTSTIPICIYQEDAEKNKEILKKLETNEFIVILYHVNVHEDYTKLPINIYNPIKIITLSFDLDDKIMKILHPLLPCILFITRLCIPGTYDCIRWKSLLGCNDTNFQMLQWFGIVYDMWEEISDYENDELQRNLQMEEYEYKFYNNLL